MTATLLLADASVTIQRVVELTFAGADVTVVAVGDGDSALARIDREPPDIVLADVGTPGTSGYEIARHVKQSTRLAHIPVLLLAGAFGTIDQAKADEAGCDGVLTKPLEPRLLSDRVKSLLDARREAAGAEAVGPEAAVAPAHALPPPASVEDYFDRLDAAFAALRATPADRSLPSPEPTSTRDLPGPPPSMPDLAEAVAALVGGSQDRQRQTKQGSEDERTAAPPGTGPSPVVTDELIDLVAQRVLERLSDQVVRETVAGIVSAVAEQLVREEIERLKASIRQL